MKVFRRVVEMETMRGCVYLEAFDKKWCFMVGTCMCVGWSRDVVDISGKEMGAETSFRNGVTLRK